MATFNGSSKEFNDFIGPLARNIVCNLSRKIKEKTTCRHDGCKKRKPLEAAHLKGKGRIEIIASILAPFEIEDDFFEIDLELFKSEFKDAHTPIENVILPMCKEHHLEYDREENIKPEYPIILDEFENEDGNTFYTSDDLEKFEEEDNKDLYTSIKKIGYSTIKDKIRNIYNINKSQISFSRISQSNNLWNFDVKKKKFKKDFYFVFYNDKSKSYKIALFKANTIDLNKFSEKDKYTIRFFVDEALKDRCSFDFNPYLLDIR
ncbi:hypothetical protein [Lacinutrix mariniflava]|uniref:hypothetical protein n=1 Tax=Lacinutrix mariniflava TaxID=342955 RepID=UPI0006E1374C|nr:hypothetical protein [Lacinutrix mariniflava]